MTHIVIADTNKRATGTGECNPETLLTEAATNGGASVYQSTNAADLQAKILEFEDAIDWENLTIFGGCRPLPGGWVMWCTPLRLPFSGWQICLLA